MCEDGATAYSGRHVNARPGALFEVSPVLEGKMYGRLFLLLQRKNQRLRFTVVGRMETVFLS
jgi:hypothetical protein